MVNAAMNTFCPDLALSAQRDLGARFFILFADAARRRRCDHQPLGNLVDHVIVMLYCLPARHEGRASPAILSPRADRQWLVIAIEGTYLSR
jgi:hypothetical protein